MNISNQYPNQNKRPLQLQLIRIKPSESQNLSVCSYFDFSEIFSPPIISTRTVPKIFFPRFLESNLGSGTLGFAYANPSKRFFQTKFSGLKTLFMKKTVSNSIKGLEGKFETSAKFWSGPIENIELASEGNFNVIEFSEINFLKEK